MSISEVSGMVTTVVKYINSMKNRFGSLMTTSMSDVTKLTRVEPLTILSKDLVNLEYMPDVCNSMLSISSGYYLQAVSILTKVNSVETVRNLDRLNPDRDASGLMLQNGRSDTASIESLSLEAYKYSLPHVRLSTPGLEDGPVNDLKQLNDVVNLSVGKVMNVCFDGTTISNMSALEIAEANQKAAKAGITLDEYVIRENKSSVVPVAFRLMASIVPDSTILQLMAGNGQDNSIVERYHAWRAGRIGFIKDLIFCQDLIDEYKRATISDESGTIQEIIRRVNNSRKFGLLTQNPSLASASNLFIISEEVARNVESKLGGRLSNPNIRKSIFDNTYAMVIAVVDRERERVVFYTRGIAASTDVSIKEIKAANKGKGPDVGDMLKSMINGMPASF